MSSILGDTPVATLTTEAVRLELQKVGATLSSSAEVTMHLEEGLHRRLVSMLTAYVLTEHLVGDTYSKDYYVPTSWFQQFKLEHLPTIARRWPVRYERRTVTVKFDRYASYPRASLAVPKDRLGQPILLERAVEL